MSDELIDERTILLESKEALDVYISDLPPIRRFTKEDFPHPHIYHPIIERYPNGMGCFRWQIAYYIPNKDESP